VQPQLAISVHRRGISGVVSEAETMFGLEKFKRTQHGLVTDINAVIERALDAGGDFIEIPGS